MGNRPSPLQTNPVVLLTGASSGFGRELAIQLSQYQLTLVLTGRNKERLDETLKICERTGRAEVECMAADISVEQSCRQLVENVLEKHGRLNILFLNAGVNAHFTFEQLQDTTIFEQLMKTNFYANVYLTKSALSSLRKVHGQIVAISSISGRLGLPERSAYCASKFALTGFFESLRTEEEDIRITMVYPTSLDTPMRSNDLMGSKEASHGSKNKQESAGMAAKTVVDGLNRGQQDIYIPVKLWFGTWMQPLFPNWMRRKVKAAAKL